MNILVVDCETTGVGESDEVIELALLLCIPSNDKLVRVEEYEGLQDPECQITKSVVRLTGLTPEELTGETFDYLRIRELLTKADRLVAHNAPFDCRYLSRLFPEVEKLSWHCSMRQLPWNQLGVQSRSLNNIAVQFNLSAQRHRARADAMLLLDVLNIVPFASHVPLWRTLFRQTPLFGAS